MINEVTLWCPLMLQLLVFCLWVPKGRAFSCATLVSKGIRKAGRQPLADLVGQLHREGGGGGLGLLKLQLQVLKKRRVLTLFTHTTISFLVLELEKFVNIFGWHHSPVWDCRCRLGCSVCSHRVHRVLLVNYFFHHRPVLVNVACHVQFGHEQEAQTKAIDSSVAGHRLSATQGKGCTLVQARTPQKMQTVFISVYLAHLATVAPPTTHTPTHSHAFRLPQHSFFRKASTSRLG